MAVALTANLLDELLEVRFTFLELKATRIPDTVFRPRAHSDCLAYAKGRIETDRWIDAEDGTDVGPDSECQDLSSDSGEESAGSGEDTVASGPCRPPGVHANAWRPCVLVPVVAVPAAPMRRVVHVPEASAQLSAPTARERTTVMLRNLPNNFCRTTLLQLFDDYGFNGKYNFVYLPIDFGRQANLGYAFVNLESSRVAEEFWSTFNKFGQWPGASRKVCTVSWSSCQGWEDNVERYRNSSVMHPDVEDRFQPAIFKTGVRLAYPMPTKSLCRPRIRAQRIAQ